MPKGLKWHRFVQTPPTMTSDLLHCLDSTINNILVARLSKGYPPITQLNTAQLCGAEKATCLKFPVSHKRAELVSSSSCWHTCAHVHKHLEFISTWWVLACLEGSSRFFSKYDTLFLGCSPSSVFLSCSLSPPPDCSSWQAFRLCR